MMASREHEKNLPVVIEKALEDAKIGSIEAVDAVAVTVGPGLSLCLAKGVDVAKKMCTDHSIPLFPVHHVEAHTLVPRMHDPSIDYPFLALVASGGHTLFVLAESHGRYRRLGTTMDDAAGEAFDKVARMLGVTESFAGHGGAALERAAQRGDASRCAKTLPIPLRNSRHHRDSCDLSFSGLKTAVLYATRDDATVKSLTSSFVADYAAAFQNAAVTHICDRAKKAIDACRHEYDVSVDTLVVSGGVAANDHLRTKLNVLGKDNALRVAFPPVSLCTDNGVMIAWAAIEAHRAGVEPLTDVSSLGVTPRWPLGLDGRL